MGDLVKFEDVSIGDCIFFRLPHAGVRKFFFGEVIAMYDIEKAFSVMTANDGYRVVLPQNSAWTEKQIKKMKYLPPEDTYTKDQGDVDDEQIIEGKSKVCDGQDPKPKNPRPKKRGNNNSKVSTSKSKTVRRAKEPKSKVRTNRKISRSKK